MYCSCYGMNDGVVVEYCLPCPLPHCTAGWGSKNAEGRRSEISEELWGVCTSTFNVQWLYGRGFQVRCNMRMVFLLIQCVSHRTCGVIQIPKTLGWVTVLMPKPHNIALSSLNQILLCSLPSSPSLSANDIADSKGTWESMCSGGDDWNAGTTSEN